MRVETRKITNWLQFIRKKLFLSVLKIHIKYNFKIHPLHQIAKFLFERKKVSKLIFLIFTFFVGFTDLVSSDDKWLIYFSLERGTLSIEKKFENKIWKCVQLPKNVINYESVWGLNFSPSFVWDVKIYKFFWFIKIFLWEWCYEVSSVHVLSVIN